MAEVGEEDARTNLEVYDHHDAEIVNQGEKIEIQEMQYLKLLPGINMRFLSTNTKLAESGGELLAQPDEDFEESKKKRIEILKRFLNRKIMKDPSGNSSQYLDASITIIQGNSSKKLRSKKKNALLPEYLKEDFPDRGIHEARIEARKLNEKKASSPTAMQYS